MKKSQIIRKNHEFQKIIKKRKQMVSKYIVIYEINNFKSLRVGISVSKKFANAVNRNKNRRQVRNCLDVIKPWAIKKDIIIMLRKPFLELSFEKKLKELEKSIERIKKHDTAK